MYESLQSQTYRNFEWLLINDASKDNTAEILEEYKIKSNFDIRLIHNASNQMVAYNCHQAVEIAEGEFMLFIGHDDALIPKALQILNETWDKIDQHNKNHLAGIMTNCQDQHGGLIVDEFPGAPCIGDFYRMCIDYNILGEKFFCYKTKVLREFQFSTIDRYVPESLLLYNISDKYETYFINERLRIYYINQEGVENLSSVTKIKYPKGIWFSKQEDINKRFLKMKKHPILTIKTFVMYLRMSFHGKTPISKSIMQLNTFYKKGIAIIFCPLAYMLSIADRCRKLI